MILLLVAAVCFILDAARVPAAVSWTPLAWAFVVFAAMAWLAETTGVLS
jgi:hypothetical protein